MSRYSRIAWAVSIILVLVLGPLAYQSWHETAFRNFHVVEEGVLYRSGKLSPIGLERVCYDYGIRTIINLRDADKQDDNDEQSFCANNSIGFFRLPPLQWHSPNGKIPAEKNIAKFREIMSDSRNYPVLIHCFAGIHRTGQLCAIYRMDFQGWSNADALTEMRNLGYTDQHDDVLGYMTAYTPRPTVPAASGPLRPVNWRGER